MKSKLFTRITIVAVSLSLCLISFWPLVRSGLGGMFFSIDPDVMYVANSFLFFKTGNIYYFDQPGTPAIMIMSGAIFLLSLYVKLFQNIPFISYSLNNFDSIFFLLRLLQSVVLFASLIVIFSSLKRLTNKWISILILSSLLLLFPPFYYLGVSISAEALSFLLVSLWLAAVGRSLTNGTEKGAHLIFILAGLSFASRATNFFLIPASLIFLPVSKRSKAMDKIKSVLFCGAMTLFGFTAGIFPVLSKIKLLALNIFSFASATEIHGAGRRAVFDVRSFSYSARELFGSNREAAIVAATIGAIFLAGIFNKDKVVRKISLTGLVFCFGMLAFAKFPLAHYQTFNYYAAAFLAVPLIIKIFNKYAFVIPLVLLTFYVPGVFKSYFISATSLINESAAIDRYAGINAGSSLNLWQWSRSKEFTIVWTRDYAPVVFDKSIRTMKYPIYELVGDYKVRVSGADERELFDICWDNLFLQDSFVEELIAKHPEIKKYRKSKVEGTPLYLIQSAGCAKRI